MIAETLKKSILQQAIQGKLSEQLPTDGDARDLLKIIQAEKAKLIAEGKIKKEKPLPPIKAEAIPFDIPENWQWVRLGEICEYIQRGKSPKYSTVKKYPVIAQKCNQTTGFYIDKAKFIDPDSIKSYSEERFLQDNDLLWNSTGLGTVGRMAIYNSEKNPYELAVADSHVTVIRPFKNFVANKFIFNYIISPVIQENIETMVSGSTKQKELATQTVKELLIPLPPIAEQKRIVAKLEKLMTLLERLDAAEKKLAALDKAFPDQLRKSILQQAIQGKLSEQLPTDGNARDLLKIIQAEKAKLISDGKIKKEKPLPPISADEIPFVIPQNWCWVRLGDICQINPRNKAPDDNITATFLPMSNIESGYKNSYTNLIKNWKDIKQGFTHFADGDIIFAKITPCFQNRKSVLLDNLENGIGAGTTELYVLRIYGNYIFGKYLLYFVKNSNFINDGVKNFKGTAGQQRISSEFVKNYLVPLPPLAEQKRIVAKLEKVLQLCDMLAEKISKYRGEPTK